MDYREKYTEHKYIRKIVSGMLSMTESSVVESANNNLILQNAYNELSGGILLELFGEDIWARIKKGEKIEDSAPVPSSKTVILLGHKRRRGKDTVAEIMKDEFNRRGYSVSQKSFARPMKHIVSSIFGVSLETLNNMKNESDYYRSVLQNFGSSDMKTFFGQNVWANAAINSMSQDKADIIIVSDFRFPIEGEGYENSITIKVSRPGIKDANSHISETALDDFPFEKEIVNDGTLEDLKNKAISLMDSSIIPIIPDNIKKNNESKIASLLSTGECISEAENINRRI